MRKPSFGYVVRATIAEWLLTLAFKVHPSREPKVLGGWMNLLLSLAAEARRQCRTPQPNPERNAK